MIWAQRASIVFVERHPARTSLWPLRYLDADWKTMSTPRSSARVVTAGVTVASTHTHAPTLCAAAEAAAISMTSHVGLTGDSIHKIAVSGRSAWASAFGSD